MKVPRLLYIMLALPLPVFPQAVQFIKSDTCLVCTPDPRRQPGSRKCCIDSAMQQLAHLHPDVHTRISKRQESYLFHRTLRSIQDPSTVTGFTTWTYNTLGYDKKNFVLDADVQYPISIGGKRFGLNEVQIIPRFQVRIFRDDVNVPYGNHGDASLPVRTPSAMPGLAYYHAGRNWWRDDKLFSYFVGFYGYHHSNGQDGYELDTANGHKQVNVYNGNFSEDIIMEFMVGGRIKPARNNFARFSQRNADKIANNAPGRQMFFTTSTGHEFYWKLSYEWHPKALSNTVFDSLGMMGRHRINIRTAMLILPNLMEYIGDGHLWCNIVPEKRYERWRITCNLSYILDARYYRGDDVTMLKKINFLNVSRRLNIALSCYRILGHTGQAALFARSGYYGSDEYNIYFNQSLWQFKIGLAFGFFDQPDEKDNY